MSMPTSGGSIPYTPLSTAEEKCGMIDPRWKRPLVVLFQRKEHPEIDTCEAASFIDDVKNTVHYLTERMLKMEKRIEAIEEGQ